MIFISLKSLTQKLISHLKFSQFLTITRKVFNTGNVAIFPVHVGLSMTNLSMERSQYNNNNRNWRRTFRPSNWPETSLQEAEAETESWSQFWLLSQLSQFLSCKAWLKTLLDSPGVWEWKCRQCLYFAKNIKFTMLSESFRSAISSDCRSLSWITLRWIEILPYLIPSDVSLGAKFFFWLKTKIFRNAEIYIKLHSLPAYFNPVILCDSGVWINFIWTQYGALWI